MEGLLVCDHTVRCRLHSVDGPAPVLPYLLLCRHESAHRHHCYRLQEGEQHLFTLTLEELRKTTVLLQTPAVRNVIPVIAANKNKINENLFLTFFSVHAY